ncbi:hypothetical protein BROOK1789B_415 [Bathymodiolus brooksi thiotrophic gill symbiont]|nr:hypothetical protein BROOK1789B_415 [Bathymodiolus brooksi thiotrophic gill symbiont]
MQIHKVPDELKTLWNMGLVHITTHNLKRGVGDLRNSTKYQKNKRQFQKMVYWIKHS